MTQTTPRASSPAAELPIWKGRRGVLNTVACGVLGLACAFGLWTLTERRTIVPACTAYARTHGMTYTDFKMVGVRHASTVVCILRRPDGGTQDVHLNELVPFLTDTWVGFAMTLEITVPAFAILLAIVRVSWYRRTTRAS